MLCVVKTDLCDRPISRPEESYQMWCVQLCLISKSQQ